MAGPLRILHCMRTPVGGLFRHVCDLVRAQAERGHLVGVIADASTGGTAAEARFDSLRPVCRLGIERFAMSRLPGPGDVSVSLRVERLARQLAPDVLHGHGAKGGAYARIAGTLMRRKGSGRPIRVYTPHGGSLHYAASSPAGFVYLTVERALARRTDAFLFESAFGRRAFAEKVGEPSGVVRVVHNGLAPAEFEPVLPGPAAADFVFVGELRALKGIDTMLRALGEIALGGDDPTAVIVGAGDDGDVLRRLAADLGIGARVRFPGPMPAREAFRLGRCVVVPSRAESLPYIVLEAAAARMPVIATAVGGIPEIFGDQAGRLVAPGDPQALAAAMRTVLNDPAGAAADAESLAADVSSRFSVEAMAEGVIAAYRSALNGPIKAS